MRSDCTEASLPCQTNSGTQRKITATLTNHGLEQSKIVMPCLGHYSGHFIFSSRYFVLNAPYAPLRGAVAASALPRFTSTSEIPPHNSTTLEAGRHRLVIIDSLEWSSATVGPSLSAGYICTFLSPTAGKECCCNHNNECETILHMLNIHASSLFSLIISLSLLGGAV